MIPLISAAAPIVGAGISGLFSWMGGQSAQRATAEQNAINRIYTMEANNDNRNLWAAQAQEARHMFDRSAELQREFAQHGIQWRVDDAKAAGIHPIAALGGSGASFSPSFSIPGAPAMQAPTHQASMGPANAMASMGQDLSRAVIATANQTQRNDAFTTAMQAMQVEKAGLEVELLKSQISRFRQTPTPGVPTNQRWLVDGQQATAAPNSTALIKEEPMKRTISDPKNPHMEPGAIPDVGHARDAAGTYVPVPAEQMKERIEDNWIQEVLWAFRNNVMPAMSDKYFKPPFPAPTGKQWGFTPFVGYQQRNTPFSDRFTGRR